MTEVHILSFKVRAALLSFIKGNVSLLILPLEIMLTLHRVFWWKTASLGLWRRAARAKPSTKVRVGRICYLILHPEFGRIVFLRNAGNNAVRRHIAIFTFSVVRAAWILCS